MILRDWRGADPALLRACYAREVRSWRDDLGWDTAWTWATVEQARVSWGLPGLLAFDHRGALQGWAFCMPDGERSHIGGLVASSQHAAGVLLDAIVAERAAGGLGCFIRERAPGLIDALIERGFEVERFSYLSRPLTPADARQADGFNDPANAWGDADFPDAASLLQASYLAEAGRNFAPTGSAGEWARYLAGVVQQAGCGLLDREATRVGRDAFGLQGLALVTSISADTAHLAQLAVHPDARGCGVATRLLREALASAALSGKKTMTLLVGERNERARRLYESLGFAGRTMFVAARVPDTVAASATNADRARLSASVC